MSLHKNFQDPSTSSYSSNMTFTVNNKPIGNIGFGTMRKSTSLAIVKEELLTL